LVINFKQEFKREMGLESLGPTFFLEQPVGALPIHKEEGTNQTLYKDGMF
jgi:hypothetical protein